MSCGVLRCVVRCCDVSRCVAVCLQCVAVPTSLKASECALQCPAVACSGLPCFAVCCNVVQCVATWYSVLQRGAVCCSDLRQRL